MAEARGPAGTEPPDRSEFRGPTAAEAVDWQAGDQRGRGMTFNRRLIMWTTVTLVVIVVLLMCWHDPVEAATGSGVRYLPGGPVPPDTCAQPAASAAVV